MIEVRQTFNDSLQAREWEEKVLRRLNAVKSERWLNRSGGNKKFYFIHHSSETKQKISEKNKGAKRSVEHKQRTSKQFKGISLPSSHKNKIRQSLKGKQKSECHKQKISENHADFSGANNPMYGKTHSESTIKKMSDIKTGKNNPCYGIRFQWVTDGKSNRKINENEIIPPGFKKGKSQKKIYENI